MSGRILLAALISEVGGIFTSWLITGTIFHPFQACTANVRNTRRRAAPVTLSSAVFININKGVVIGLLLDWPTVCLLPGGVAGWLLG
jgi:hypothetical protein